MPPFSPGVMALICRTTRQTLLWNMCGRPLRIPRAFASSNTPSPTSLWTRLSAYGELSKARLSSMVVLTAAAGYAMGTVGPPVWSKLVWTSVGTALCAGSACSVNQLMERDSDAVMQRTQARPLPSGRIPPSHALTFGIVTGAAGVGTLLATTNLLTASLGAGNILLYTHGYGRLKPVSTWNLWIGAIVGGIPPLMGWAAATGGLHGGALVMGYILFGWQIPHFMSLAFLCRDDFQRANFAIHAVRDPKYAARLSLRYSQSMFGLGVVAPVLGMTSWWFLPAATMITSPLVYRARRFAQEPSNEDARRLFHTTLIYLPLLLAALLVCKREVPSNNSS